MNVTPQHDHVESGASADFGRHDEQRDRAALTPMRANDVFSRDVWSVLGVALDMADLDQAVSVVETAIDNRRRLSFVTPNVNWLVRALKDKNARAYVNEADLSLADGAPLIPIARAIGAPLRMRVAGSDLFEALRRKPRFARPRPARVFFFGGQGDAAQEAAARLTEDRGALEGAGGVNPGNGDVEALSDPETIDQVNAADADFLVVALGAHKGQSWIKRNLNALNAPVVAHLGAVVDFTAGRIARAPRLVQRLGLEWLWRIKEDPTLWRRYVDDGADLLRLLAFRAAPLAIASARQKSTGEARVSMRAMPLESRVRISGDWRYGGLDPLRDAFRAACARERTIVLDLKGLGIVDAAFLGQILMLETQAKRFGLKLRVDNVSPRHARILALHGFEFVSEPSGVVTDDELAASEGGDMAKKPAPRYASRVQA